VKRKMERGKMAGEREKRGRTEDVKLTRIRDEARVEAVELCGITWRLQRCDGGEVVRREVVVVVSVGGLVRLVSCPLSVKMIDGRKGADRIGSVMKKSVEICEGTKGLASR
jgi:hypothetical protein